MAKLFSPSYTLPIGYRRGKASV